MLACPICRSTFADGTSACFIDGAKLEAAPSVEPDPLVGQMLDSRLRVLRCIGEGARARSTRRSTSAWASRLQ